MKYIQTLKSKIIISLIPGLLLGYSWGTTLYLDAPVQPVLKLNAAILGFFVGFILSLILLYIIEYIGFYGWRNSYRLNKFKIVVFIILFIVSIFPIIHKSSSDSYIGLPFSFLKASQYNLPVFPFYFLSFTVDNGEFIIEFYLLNLLANILLIYTASVLLALKFKKY